MLVTYLFYLSIGAIAIFLVGGGVVGIQAALRDSRSDDR
jgi:hypothetical protein